MKDCCQSNAPKNRFQRIVNTVTTAIILLIILGGLLLAFLK